ncbi:FRG domain-containing protein [Pseudomonas viridiflava]|uniref:FRG domain-containing protein n=1 Tax=Pseudomonas viridiflava TaxID=33069 RepID=UPI0015E3EC8C|nr:FRG domain-containing protein [Pseudomonas viridiflava]MBA1232738.1 FRG domain-containing protein [Pseudomonas viridiflava]
MSNLVYEKHLNVAEDFMDFLMPWSGQHKDIDLKKYIFRGQRNAGHALIPFALRENAREEMRKKMEIFVETHPDYKDSPYILALVEYQLIRDFYRQSDMHGLPVPSSKTLRNVHYKKIDLHTMGNWIEDAVWLPDDMLEAAALAQHYGIPTRLLDWSYNPSVAAFFATLPKLEGSDSGFKKDGRFCVWGLNTEAVGTFHMFHEAAKLHPMSLPFPEFPLKLVTPPYDGNPNLAAQQGLFTHWASQPGSINSVMSESPYNASRSDLCLEKQIEEFSKKLQFHGISNMLLKVTLPNAEAEKVARYLRDQGYGPSRLFPGYDGVTREINERIYFTRKRKT